MAVSFHTDIIVEKILIFASLNEKQMVRLFAGCLTGAIRNGNQNYGKAQDMK